jgi:hypothetical protein
VDALEGYVKILIGCLNVPAELAGDFDAVTAPKAEETDGV